MKCVYQAVNKESAGNELLKLEEKWGEQYPIVIRSWQDNWDKLSEYFQYTQAIRKLIYTTNTVEGYHRQIRKVTKKTRAYSRRIRPLKNWFILHTAHTEEVDHATCQLGYNLTTTRHKVWRPV